MTPTENRWKRLIVRWTRRKGFTAFTLFLILIVIAEALSVYSFQVLGLADSNVWASTFLIPYANWSFTVSLSPLFHLLPLSVIIVLLSSWTYLTKTNVFVPKRVETARRVSTPTRREQESRRFKSLRRLSKRLTRRLQRFGRALKTGANRIPDVSYISERLVFARAAVRSAVTVLLVFFSAVFLLALVEYPDLIHSWTLNLYRGSPAFLNFVLGVDQWLSGVGQALPPLGGVGSSIINALTGVSPGFWHSIRGAGTALTPITKLDTVSKYVLSQNVAAWTSALIALAYGAYASSRSIRRPRR